MQKRVGRLVPIPDSCEVLGGLGRTKVYDLISGGELVKVNIGSRAFITADSLEAYLERLVESAHGSSAAVGGTTPTSGDAGAGEE